MKKVLIQAKRVYDPPGKEDGERFLIDRLWPRGMKKEAMKLDGWLKEVAPTNSLRRWFGHDPKKWEEFQHRYSKELDEKTEVLEPLMRAAKKGTFTLLFSAKDRQHNNAVVLKNYLIRLFAVS